LDAWQIPAGCFVPPCPESPGSRHCAPDDSPKDCAILHHEKSKEKKTMALVGQVKLPPCFRKGKISLLGFLPITINKEPKSDSGKG
jgi:hypothetical protein